MEVAEVVAVAALLSAEGLAMALTWRDPVLTSVADRALTILIWPVFAAIGVWRGLDAGFDLVTICWMGVAALVAACLFTWGQPGVFFLSIRANGAIDRSRLWRRVGGYVGLVVSSVIVGYLVATSPGSPYAP